MQIFLTLEFANNTMSVNYRTYIHGLIYDALGMNAFSEQLHNMHSSRSDGAFKGFCFSPIIGPHNVWNREITFNGICKLEIRCINEQVAYKLYKSFSEKQSIKIGNHNILLVSCRIGDYHVLQDVITVVPRPAIVVYSTRSDGYRNYYSPDDDIFYRAIVDNARKKWRVFGDGSTFEMEIERNINERTPRVMAEFKGTYITGWGGVYTLRGNPKVLDMLYQIGIGSKNSEGFGMLSIR